GRKRRTHWKIKLSGFSTCPRCGNFKLPHRVCTFCGYYKEMPVIEIVEKKKE
ncbi:MAG: 50S ribosomal protein L32, partial [candidate division WOR-3 bacterium]